MPLSELARFKVSPEEILRLEYSPRFFELANSVAQRARHFYQLARETLPAADRRSMVAAELMGSVYWRLLRKLERQRFNVFGPELTRLNKGQKALLILRTWCRALHLRAPRRHRLWRLSPNPAPRRLIVNADDFGRSASINQAVIRAHREGILTTASLMVNEPACEEAVALARENPTLGVGLHLTLLCGHSALPPEQIPGLVNAQGRIHQQPSRRRASAISSSAACASSCGGKSTRSFRSSAPPGCPWTTSTAICTCTCIRRYSAS